MIRLSIVLGLLFLVSLSAQAAPPAVSLVQPANAATWGAVTTLYAYVNATDSDGTIAKVEFYIDDVLIATDTAPDYGSPTTFSTFLSPRPAPGAHTITAKAYDNSGESTVTPARTINVTVPPPPPDATTGAVGYLTAVSASVSGTFNPRGVLVTTHDVWIEYGLTTDYGADTKASVRVIPTPQYSGDTTYPYSYNIQNLQRGATYHYRMVAQSPFGTSYGVDATFTTAENLPPIADDAGANVVGLDPVPVYCGFGDLDGEQVTVISFTQPSHGSVVEGFPGVNANFTYTPDETFAGVDQFTYTVQDEHGATATATAYLYDVRQASGGQYVLTITTEGRTLQWAGFAALSVTRTGSFSGVLTLFGARYPLRGRFSADGVFQTEIDRVGAPPFQLSLGEWGAKDGLQVGGYISGAGDFLINSGKRLAFTSNAPQAGAYTMVLPLQSGAQSGAPLANGYVVGSVSRHGRVVFTGRIGDGQAFSFGTQLRAGGTADLAITAGQAPRDRLHGQIQFPGTESDLSTGTLFWYRAPRTSGYFQEGFHTYVDVTGSRFRLSHREDQILDYSTELAGVDIHFEDLNGADLLDGTLSGTSEASLVFEESSLQSGTSAIASAARAPHRAAAPAKTVTLRLNRRNGTFTGTLRVPTEQGRLRAFGGVLLQHQNIGSGLLMFGGRAGKVTITPH